MVFFAFPLDVAADRVGYRNEGLVTGEKRIHRVAQLVGLFLAGGARIVIHAAGIAELAIAIKNIEMRRAQGAIGQRDGLAFIAHVGVFESLLLGAADHIVEGITGMAFG